MTNGLTVEAVIGLNKSPLKPISFINSWYGHSHSGARGLSVRNSNIILLPINSTMFFMGFQSPLACFSDPVSSVFAAQQFSRPSFGDINASPLANVIVSQSHLLRGHESNSRCKRAREANDFACGDDVSLLQAFNPPLSLLVPSTGNRKHPAPPS